MRVGNSNARFQRMPFLTLLFGLLATLLGESPPAVAETVWTGPQLSFTKPDFADPTVPTFQDAIVPGFSLTRANNRGLYNVALESFFTIGTSPADSEWAWILNNPALAPSEIRATNYAALNFEDWTTAHGNQPLATLGIPGVLHIVSQDVYIDITMTAWTSGASGGGFSYTRSTPPPQTVPVLGFPGHALVAVGISICAVRVAGRRLLVASRNGA